MSFIGVQMAKRLGAASQIEANRDLAVTVRPASTANFYVDSVDKNQIAPLADVGSGDFIIAKNQSLFNGFFTRMAVSELVMDWGLPNIAAHWGNNSLTVYINNGGTVAGPFTVTLQDGFYSALDTLNALVTALNANSGVIGTSTTFSVGTSGTKVGLGATKNFVVVWDGVTGKALARQLFTSAVLYTGALPPLAASITAAAIYCVSPLVLGTRYVDIVCPQLTYNQDLKDNTTAPVQRDVLYRWYLAWDTIPGNDSLSTGGGTTLQAFPVYQGYRPFVQRRALPYPKQISWNNTQPLGQVQFQVFDDSNQLINTSDFTGGANFQFQLSMLVTEN